MGFARVIILAAVLLAAPAAGCRHSGECGRCAHSAPSAAAKPPADIEARLSEIEKRLDYLTAEIADQRGAVDKIREKLNVPPEGAGR